MNYGPSPAHPIPGRSSVGNCPTCLANIDHEGSCQRNAVACSCHTEDGRSKTPDWQKIQCALCGKKTTLVEVPYFNALCPGGHATPKGWERVRLSDGILKDCCSAEHAEWLRRALNIGPLALDLLLDIGPHLRGK